MILTQYVQQCRKMYELQFFHPSISLLTSCPSSSAAEEDDDDDDDGGDDEEDNGGRTTVHMYLATYIHGCIYALIRAVCIYRP